MTNKTVIVKGKPEIFKEIENDYLKAILYNTGVIEIVWNTSILTIEVFHLKQMQEVVAKIGGGKKMPLYFSMHEFLGINDEARRYATSDEGVKYTLATTVLVDNLAKKLLMNFFMNMFTPKVPTKGFSNREDALLWLEKIGKENQF